MAARIKICGLTRPEDALAAADAGATYGGVILAPNSPRTVLPVSVPEIFGDTALLRCGVFVDEEPARIAELAAELCLDVVQLHGDETLEFLAELRRAFTGEIWKAVRPRSGQEFAWSAGRFSGAADGLMLDGWSPAARGGTGTQFPWRDVAVYRDRLDPRRRLIVAGGLTPENVTQVTAILSPDVVDVSSGVESSPGIKNHEAIRRFAAAVHGERPTGDLMDGSTQRA
jgi:phosphoribosylanthranilate isomerase